MNILESFKSKIANVSSLEELEEIKVEFLGRKGLLTLEMSQLKDLSNEERTLRGKELNSIKNDLLHLMEIKLAEVQEKELNSRLASEGLDTSIEGRRLQLGTLHPITKIIKEVKGIFSRMGFELVDGPEIESVFRNFDALNVPQAHPSRNLSDTFYFENGKLLRTHTTTVQIKCLQEKRLPIIAISGGKVYRPDYDATHTPMFHQIDGLFLSKNASFANLKAILSEFISIMFPNSETRFRPHFFPFTEPSAELDMSCPACSGSGCSICKQSGWIEILGCGMVSPEVLKHFGYTLDDARGFAFGMGVERLAMIKFGIKDIRLLYDNDLRLLKQFI